MEDNDGGMELDPVAEKLGVPTDMHYTDNSMDLDRAASVYLLQSYAPCLLLWYPSILMGGEEKQYELVFFGGEAFCLVCAGLYHKFLPPGITSATTRHLVATVLGVAVGYFSFGLQFSHVILQSTLCLVSLHVFPANAMHIVTFCIAMTYLVSLHLYRAFMIPEEVLYSIDVSGPLMIVTQKICTLAFSIHDGCHSNKDKLSDLQKRYRISKPPSTLEYFSYLFYFQGIVVGPLSFYNDYVAYIQGTDIVDQHNNGQMQNNNVKHGLSNRPSPMGTVCYKLCVTMVWMFFHFTMKPQFPEMLNADAAFIQSHGFLHRVWYMLISMLCCRAKYYVAFTLGDAICNASGFGFNGYDEQGHARWDLITNVNILGIELATSPKVYLDNWNIQSATWLRHVCYDRCPVQKRFATFILSAVWHGCYPGYYFTFVAFAPFSEISRKMRRKIRPYFQGSSSVAQLYDVITWLATHTCISYLVVPFTVLHLASTIAFYNQMYWCLHIVCALLFFLLPYIPTYTKGGKSARNFESAPSKNNFQDVHSNGAVMNGLKAE